LILNIYYKVIKNVNFYYEIIYESL